MFSAMILVIVLASLLAMYFYIEEKNSANNQSLEIVADKVQNIEDKLSITNEDSKAIIFTQRIRILINNIDAMLRRQEQVVRRIYRNKRTI